MKTILHLVESMFGKAREENGRTPVSNLGFISCVNQVHLRHVPFYEPCVILVLSGQKLVFESEKPVLCQAGCAITVPAHSSVDICNEPDKFQNSYKALVIPFRDDHLEYLCKTHDLGHSGYCDEIGVLKFECDDALKSIVRHYLECPDDSMHRDHRLSEILLYLVRKDARLLSYSLAGNSWAHRVRSVLSSDLVHDWSVGEVCDRLATSETTLRRKLRQEETGFRELLYELRLSNGLTQLLQTTRPVYQIAYDCGYQSVSRFTSNFRKRFGITPTLLRSSVGETEQNLVAGEHSRAL